MTGPAAGGFLSLTALWAEGCGIALRAMSIICCQRQRKPYNLASLDGNAPLLPTAPPPEGEVCSPLFLVLTYVAHFIAPLESPPPGWQRNWICRGVKRPENPVTCFPVERCRQRRQKGCISHARQGGLPVFHRAKPGCKGFIQTGGGAAHHNPHGRRPCQTLAP